MKFSISTAAPEKNKKNCLIVGVFEGGKLSASAKEIDKASKGQLAKLLAKGGMDGKFGQSLNLLNLSGAGFEHVLLIGCGNAEKITPIIYRKIIISAINAALISKATSAVCYLAELAVEKYAMPWKVKQIAEATYVTLYRLTNIKPQKNLPIV